MDDDRLRRQLSAIEGFAEPDPEFLERLYRSVRVEAGLASATAQTATDAGLRKSRRSRRWPLLLVAALVGTGIAGAIGSGALRLQPPDRHRSSSLLGEIRRTGSIRLAVRPDHPQFASGGAFATGFDTDIANELAARIGVSSQVVVVTEPEMARGASGQWDVALPSVPTWTVDGSRFITSEPYYYWPHLVVVGDDSAIAALADLANAKVCAVAGDGGEAWLSGGESGAFGTAPPTSLITLPDDDSCLAALAAGQVDALVTAHLSSADIAVRSGIHSIGGPPPEPRAVIVERMSAGSADATDLVAAINSAIDAARGDGTLTRFSQSRFGGSDLTTSN